MDAVFSDEYFMRTALRLAQQAMEENEVPVGALVVCNNRVIGKGYNQTETMRDVTAHAEILAITAASSFLGAKYLKDCTLYVTLEPCVMCAGAIFWSQVDRLVYGANDEKRGFTMVESSLLHPKTLISKGVLADESGNLVKEFFKGKR